MQLTRIFKQKLRIFRSQGVSEMERRWIGVGKAKNGLKLHCQQKQSLRKVINIKIILMQNTISRLEGIANFKEGLRSTCRANRISITVLNGLTIAKIKTIYNRTLQHYQANPDKAKSSWFQNQLRLFQWVIVIESFLSKQLLNQFTSQQWHKIQTYFTTKPTSLFEFEAKKLLYSDCPQNSRNWSLEECQILVKIMRDQSLLNRWNDVARMFFEQSGKKFFRSSKQCRQQWYNHLDTSKIHGSWKTAQDRAILEFVLKNGHRWALLCKQLLPHRTEHMIKNRFKSLLMKGQQEGKKEKITERKQIRILLGNRAQDHENICQQREQPIKKQTTLTTQRDLRMLEENESFQYDFSPQVKENGSNSPQIQKQVIEEGEQKQKQYSQERALIKPTPYLQPHFPPASPMCEPRPIQTHLMNASSYLAPQPLPFFNTYSPCFAFFPSVMVPMSQEQPLPNVEREESE